MSCLLKRVVHLILDSYGRGGRGMEEGEDEVGVEVDMETTKVLIPGIIFFHVKIQPFLFIFEY